MRKRGAIVLLLIFSLLFSSLLFSPFASASSFTGTFTGRVFDNLRMTFANDDGKVDIALEVREKDINSAIENAKSGNIEEAIKNLEDAKKKLEIIQDKASSDVVEKVQENLREMKEKLLAIEDLPPEFEDYINNYMTEEEKTKLSMGLSEKLFNYCTELAKQNYEAMLEDEKCKSANAPDWLKGKVDDKIEELDKNTSEKILEILTVCIKDPRGCDCSGIPSGTERTKCEEGKALAIRCEFQNDESACKQMNNLEIEIPSNLPKFLQPIFGQKLKDAISDKEKEMFGKFAPKECIDAGATTREACEKIMMEKNAPRQCIEAGATTKEACEKIMIGINGPPPTECTENGEFIGPEACDEKMVKSGKIPQECVKDGKSLSPEECQVIMGEKGMMNKPDLSTIPKECIKNGQAISQEECMNLMKELGITPPGGAPGNAPGNVPGNLPPECMQNGQPIPEQDCMEIMQEKGITPSQQQGNMMSGECKEQGITDFYECQKIVNLPRPCKDAGIYDSAQCEEQIMSQNMPGECVSANALTPNACRQIMLPQECKDIGASNWEDCETTRITQRMPEQCLQEGKSNPEECAQILAENVISSSPGSEMDFLSKKGIRQSEIPSVCMSGSNFVRSMDCDEELTQMGITLPAPSDISNIPRECMINGEPVLPQECQTIMESKLVNENIPGPCREAGITEPDECGRFMSNQRAESGLGMNIPQECLGLSPEECRVIMEEKGIEMKKSPIEGGEQIPRECIELGVSDENSCNTIMSRINEERMNNGEKMVVDQEGNQDYITSDEVNQIIREAEQNLETQPDFESAEAYKQQVEYYENEIDEIEQTQETEQAEIETGLAPEISGSGGEQGGAQSGGEISGGAGGGESAPTGEAIREISSVDNFLTRFLDRIFG